MARPASPDPKSEFVPLRMTVGEAHDLERAAAKAGMARSVFIRDCVRRCIAADKRKEAALRGKRLTDAAES